MTWYASQIYAEPTPAVRSIFAAHPVLSKGTYLLDRIENFHWPEGDAARYDQPHGLPPQGLLVGRELCAPGSREFAFHRDQALSWDTIVGPADVPVMRLSHLPSTSNGTTYFDSEWAGGHPPKGFLKFLKNVSRTTNTKVAFYHHASGAEQSAQQELAWIFGKEDYVLAAYIPDENFITRFAPTTTAKIPRSGHNGKSVLQLVLSHFGLELPSLYFAPHTRGFSWQQYKI